MERFGLVQFTRKTGKITMSMEGYGKGMLGLWAIQNTTKSRDTIVFSIDTGRVDKYYGGQDGMPNVIRPEEDNNEVQYIDGYCPGLLEAYRRDSKLEDRYHESN